MAKVSTAQQWSTAWTLTLERLGLLKRGAHSHTGRQRSRIKRIEVLPGRVHAEVQDQVQGNCHVTLKFAPLTERAWVQLVESLENHLQTSAQRSMDELLRDPGPFFPELSGLLLPSGLDEITAECSCCPTGTTPCPGCELVYRQVGAMLNEEPILLLRLRGREWQALQQALQSRRTADYLGALPATNGAGKGAGENTASVVSAAQATQGERTSEPLDQTIGHFWGSRKALDAMRYHITAPLIDLALLRRLGPLPTTLDDDDLYQEIARIYRHITTEAQALAYSLDAPDGVNAPTSGTLDVK